MVKRLPNYTTTVNISKITTQGGKGSIDFHNDLSVSSGLKPIMFKWLNVFHDIKLKKALVFSKISNSHPLKHVK